MSARIRSTGVYLPKLEVRNESLTQFPASSIPLIEQKTGVRARRVADPSQCTSDLALHAARACLADAGFDPADLDAILLATSSPDRIQPATATRVQHGLGAGRAFAFDVNAVCSGALYALHLAHALIESGFHRNVLVVAAEMYSRFLNPMDFSTFPYFGDGAGALMLSADAGRGNVVATVLGTDGSGHDVIQVPAGGTMLPLSRVKDPKEAYFTMRGKEVYAFAVRAATRAVRDVLANAGVAKDDIAFVVPHQANLSIVKAIAAELGLPEDKFVVNLHRYGNTAGASVLIALDELLRSGRTRPGDRVVLVAFGGGLSWGATLLEL